VCKPFSRWKDAIEVSSINDIGLYVAVRKSIDNATKERLMKAAWIPNETFKFPTEPKRML